MKITKQQLKKLIKEELSLTILEELPLAARLSREADPHLPEDPPESGDSVWAQKRVDKKLDDISFKLDQILAKMDAH